MEKLSKLLPNNLYHSYVIESNNDIVSSYLLEILEERKIINGNNGDVFILTCDSLTMEDGLKIKEWHKSKSIGLGKKICIISTKFINREAEQSLLKIIEEPNENTHFFIIVPDSSLLLSTILSRVHILKNIYQEKLDSNKIAEELLKSSLKNRLDKIIEIIKRFKDKESSGGLRFQAISILNSLEKIIYEKWKKDLNNKDLIFILEEIKKGRVYLSTPGASVKMILEHLMMII
ncbi:TPA: hypothetical protein DIC38_02310 [Candidatus Nomurabacteria bacterium]|nr:MAG: hypothetical protein O210_OD1C00001G0270 [Parcubacteria bacterium RAAC4_OD1_1]HCY26487.1 hypothetical protein [Candidatus Nomurabacteria bacterium]